MAHKKNASAAGLFLQGQSLAVVRQAREALNELRFAEFQKVREPCNLGLRQAHLSWPATAGRAALTLVKDRHGRTITGTTACAKEQSNSRTPSGPTFSGGWTFARGLHYVPSFSAAAN